MVKQYDVPGVITNVSSPGVKGQVSFDYDSDMEVWGHLISFTEHGLECSVCEMEEEVPDIIRFSSSENEELYRLYMFGKFKATDCKTFPFELDDDGSTLDRTHTYTTNNPRIVDNYHSPGDHITVDGTDYTYEGGGRWTSRTAPAATTEEILARHGNDAVDELPRVLVQEAHKGIQRKRQEQARVPSGELVTIDNPVDSIDTTITRWDISTAISDDSDDSDDSEDTTPREKLARAVGRATERFK